MATLTQVVTERYGSDLGYPVRELQWLIAMSWNTGLELFAGGRLEHADSLFRVSLDILKYESVRDCHNRVLIL